MTLERFNFINNEIDKIRACDRITEQEADELEMMLFQSKEEFEEFSDIENGLSKPMTKQDILEEIADQKYNEVKEGF